MTSLLSAKKRAEEFAAVVDGGADESTLRPELAELLEVVGTLRDEGRTGADLAPRPEFTATLRERLMAEASTSLAQDTILTLPVRRKGSRERRLALVASSLVLVGGSAGMAAAAQNALPGEALYPIKRGLEKAQTGLATSRADQGQDLLAQADSRLVEVRGLFEDEAASQSQVPSTLDDFTLQALEASDLLIKEFETSRDPSLIEELRTFAADKLEELQELSKSAAPEHQDELALAADALMQIDARAQAVCPSCATELRSLKMPPLFLTANEALEAIQAAGRVVVDNSHPVVSGEVETTPAGKGGGRDGEGRKDQGGADDGPTDEPTDQPTDQPTDGDTGSGLPGLPDTDVDTTTPDDPPKILEGVTGALGGKGTDDGEGSKDGGSKDGGETEDVLPEELESVVDAILP